MTYDDSRQAFDAWWTEVGGPDAYTFEYETALMAWMAGASWHSQTLIRERQQYLQALERTSVIVAPEDL